MQQNSILRIEKGTCLKGETCVQRAVSLNRYHRILKRSFDIVFSFSGLCVTGWLIGLAIVGARMSTGQSGLFRQRRVGQFGRTFEILKIRTMRDVPGIQTTVTTDADPRITRLGRLLRKYKIDELPQLYNVLRGDMSFVGPRPDVPELIVNLQGDDRVVLSVRPGITGPASIKYRNEEELLAMQIDPDAYNRLVIFPDKTRINRDYVERYRFLNDIHLVVQTLVGGGETARPESIGSLERDRAA